MRCDRTMGHLLMSPWDPGRWILLGVPMNSCEWEFCTCNYNNFIYDEEDKHKYELTRTIEPEPVIAKTVQTKTISRYHANVPRGGISLGAIHRCQNVNFFSFLEDVILFCMGEKRCEVDRIVGYLRWSIEHCTLAQSVILFVLSSRNVLEAFML